MESFSHHCRRIGIEFECHQWRKFYTSKPVKFDCSNYVSYTFNPVKFDFNNYVFLIFSCDAGTSSGKTLAEAELFYSEQKKVGV